MVTGYYNFVFMSLLLVGAGSIAVEYWKVLSALGKSCLVVGRGKESAKNFQNATGVAPYIGGIENWLRENSGEIPKQAIVCVSELDLGKVTRILILAGVKEILTEKPGGFTARDIRDTARLAEEKKCQVYLAYNRRFYASVRKAHELILADGGAVSFTFEFTEWIHKIPETKFSAGIVKEWFLANSTHVIDLAFFLGGRPKKLEAFSMPTFEWHNGGSVFSGTGITENSALFSYHANWKSAGRWGVEVCTNKHRYILRPLEKLFIQNIGSVDISEVKIDDQRDATYKPGFYLQTASFLGDKKNLPTIAEQIELLPWYEKMNRSTV